MGELGLHDEVVSATEEEPELVAEDQVDEDDIEDNTGLPSGQCANLPR